MGVDEMKKQAVEELVFHHFEGPKSIASHCMFSTEKSNIILLSSGSKLGLLISDSKSSDHDYDEKFQQNAIHPLDISVSGVLNPEIKILCLWVLPPNDAFQCQFDCQSSEQSNLVEQSLITLAVSIIDQGQEESCRLVCIDAAQIAFDMPENRFCIELESLTNNVDMRSSIKDHSKDPSHAGRNPIPLRPLSLILLDAAPVLLR
jgi:hypothetical protein